MKKLLISIISVCLCANVNAESKINHGVLLSHFEEHNVSLPASLKKNSSPSTMAIAYPQNGFVNQNITVMGYVSYYILNDTSMTKNYWIDKYICIDTKFCSHYRDTVSLEPSLTAFGEAEIYNTSLITTSGNHENDVYIYVNDGEISSSESIATIYIT